MYYRRTEVQKALIKLETMPCKCIDDITAKLKLVSISDITYEEVKGHKGRGKHKKDEKPITIAVKVHAVASINSEAVKAAVENSTYYVICTNDTERKWTIKELLSIYKKQSVVERKWRCLKDKRLLVNTLYLESPSRINALMWVMTLALLIFSATEYLMRKKMEEQRLTVPTPDHKNELSRPSWMRVYQYLANSNISLTYSPGTEFVRLTGVPLDMQQILLSMGEEWCRSYISDTYRPYIASAD